MSALTDSALSARQRIAAFWQSRTLRERRWLLAGAIMLTGWLSWSVIIDPAIRTRRQMQQQLPELRAQSARMQALIREVNALPAAAAPTADRSALSREGLERSLTEAGLRAQHITITGNAVTLNFSDQPFSALTDWLQTMQREQHLSVSEATVSARERPDRVDATLSLQRPA